MPSNPRYQADAGQGRCLPQPVDKSSLPGAIGLAVGLAPQDGIRNLLAGVMMIFNPPFRVGDMVRWGTHYGEVERIDLSVTWLHTFNDDVIMVPNAGILTQAIVNSSSRELAELVTVDVDLPDQVPVMRVMELALEVARCSPYSYLKKPATVIVEPRHEYRGLLRFTIKAYVLDARLERRLASDITGRFYEALQENGLLVNIAPIAAASRSIHRGV